MRADIYKFSQFLGKWKLHLEVRALLAIFIVLSLAGCKPEKKNPPSISSITPISGNFSGGTLVTISGSDFASGAAVSIGSSACNVVSLSSSQISCTTPANSSGTYNVTVTNPNRQSVSLASAYTYYGAPSVSSVSPTIGFAIGGTVVTITGSEFRTGATVSFGGSACTGVTVMSSTLIACTTSAHAAGAVNVVVTNTDAQYGSKTSGYTFRAAPTVSSVSANAGALAGGTTVTINGTGFYAGAAVDFGGSACTPVTISATSIVCTTAAHAAGAVTVTVTNADTQLGSLAAAYTYQAAPTVTSVAPNAGALGGGTSVTITGTGFLPGAGATFGGVACTSLLVMSPTTITCTTPMQFITGAVNVVVTNADAQTGTLTNGYTYNLAPTVASVSPSSGLATGATAVTITGTGFLAGATVSFGGSACTGITVVSATSITCTTAAHAAGAVNVTVTNTDTQFGSAASAYTYRSPPTITSVSPNGGPLAGGTLVTITGTGFYAGPTVTFGGVACTGVTVVSATSITCTTPANAGGAVTVAITNADTQSGNLASAYTYRAAPTVTNVTPSAGPLSGGSTATITGTGFVTGATVTIGGSVCTLPVVVSATSIQCSTPAHAAGNVNVVVTNPDTQTGTLTNGYIYIAAPTVTSVAPTAGALGGATAVTITGANFIAGATVSFGGAACTAVTVVSATSITCTTPAHAAGAINVVVTNPDTQTGTLTNGYTYQAAPTVTSVSATAGALAGGTPVTITGTGFVTGATVSFGGSACTPVTVVSATSITCTTTAHAAGAAAVVVTNADTQASGAATTYTYQAAPTVTSVAATSGFAAGGTAVTITGTGFIAGATVSFGGSACTAITVVSATSITCTTAAHAAGAVTVTVTNADTQAGSAAAAYTYVAAPTVTSIAPTAGALGGATPVTITGTGFLAGATVSFGGSACTAVTVVSATSITCTTPAHAAGAVNIVVTNTDTQAGTLTNGYTYQAAPTVTSVAATAGALAGGTPVTITGTGFVAGATATFGGTACTALTVASPTSITCTTPAHAAGAAAVVVTNADTQASGAATTYTYQAAPTVTSVAPTSGFATGATAVTITGTGFIAGATVSFGGSACTAITVVSATSITCTTAAHAAGAVTVTVTNADTQAGSAAAAYTYVAAPTVTSISPNVGSINGATPVTITGTNFTAGATVSLGGTACTGVTVVSATSITCTTAAKVAGAVNVVVTNTDTQAGTLTNGFTYQSMAALAWQVGGASPTPPNPDSYGTTATNVTHTYTLKNTGDIATTTISLSITGASPAAWLFGTDNCSNTTLAAGASCTVQVTFLGQFLTPTTSYSAILNATATSGGTTTNNMSGATP